MSYILDALKKSEQERGHGSAPNVQTLHSSSLNYHSNKTHLWPYVLLSAIVINLAALFYFILVKPDTDSSVQTPAQHVETASVITPAPTQAITGRPDVAVTPQSPATEDIVYKPISLPASTRAITQHAAVTTQAENAPPAQAQGAVLERDELPFDLQQHLPIMEFSAHVYSSNPLQRSIVINGRFMEEGDHLAADLFLSEITPDGAVFNFQGQLFHQGVVSAWN